MKFKDLTSSSPKNFLSLKNAGDTVRGVFRGEIVDFRSHWVSGASERSVICHGRNTCALCKDGHKSGFRFRVNFVIQENGAYVAKTYENGKTVYENLAALDADYALEKNMMKITRHGSGKETTYAIVPVPNGALTPAQEKAISAVELNDLAITKPLDQEEPDSAE